MSEATNNEKIIAQLRDQVAQWKSKYDNLLEQFRLSKQRQYSSSSEKNLHQADFFDEAGDESNDAVTEDPEEKTLVEEHQRKKKPKRTKLSDDLPREQIYHDINESEKQCECGCQKSVIGEDKTEKLEIVPAQLKVVEHIRLKYSCKKCEEGVSIAPLPKFFLPKSVATPSLAAYTIVNKFQDHIPLHRQSKIWERYKNSIPVSTLCDWVLKSAEKCAPIYELLKKSLMNYDILAADETPLQVMSETGRENKQKSYMWVYRGGPPDKRSLVFEYQQTRAAAHVKEFLKNYRGYLQTDAYKGYDWVDNTESIIHLGCMAHARRPFAELVKLAKKSGKAHQAIAHIKKLYRVEAYIKEHNLDKEKIYNYRQENALPILNSLYQWLEKTIRNTPPAGNLGKAIKYMLDRKDELTNYCLDGRLSIDNNLVENAIRPFAVGRKNWLFAGSPRGAKAGATLYTLIESAKANDLVPFEYLKLIFTKIPLCKNQDDFEQLLPWNMKGNISQ